MASSTTKRPRLLGRPPGASGERTREEILQAALEAFAETGYDAMSVRELTRQLNVSHNLVHHYFGSKPALWRAAVDHGLEKTIRELTTLLEEAVGGPDPVATVRAGGERMMMLLARNPAVARILLDEAARGGERLDYIYNRFLKPGMDVLKRFLASARGRGLRDIDPRILLLFCMNVTSTFFTQAALAKKLGILPPASARGLDRHARALVELMLSGVVER
jgi:AcrR family transcriptional regulator